MYSIEVDDGEGGEFKVVQRADPLALAVTTTDGIVISKLYRVRYRCQNLIGFSEYSDISYILTAVQPSKPSELKVSIVGSDIVVEWLMPYNGGSLIFEAEVKFLNKEQTIFHFEKAHCDATQQAVFDARRCTIPA